MPRKLTPEQAKEMAKKAHESRRNKPKKTAMEKLEEKARKRQSKLYQLAIEERLYTYDSLYARVQDEIMSKPKGTLTGIEMDLLLKLGKQLHEVVLGKPKTPENKNSGTPVTVVINEEKLPEEHIAQPVGVTKSQTQVQVKINEEVL